MTGCDVRLLRILLYISNLSTVGPGRALRLGLVRSMGWQLVHRGGLI